MAIMFMLPGIYALVNGVFNIYGVVCLAIDR